MRKFQWCSLLLALLIALSVTMTGAIAEEPEGLLDALNGTYDELFTVICAPEYDDIWLERCVEYVGAETAPFAAAMLKSACVGEIYGQEAVEAYSVNPESAVFDCFFINGVVRFVFDGSHISGLDSEGNIVFEHDYEYVETLEDVIACYVYQTKDTDAGAFTYICLSPDTPTSTYHIEFRYGDDLEALAQYYEGKYAYWLGAGIAADRDDEMIYNVIDLFCAENLGELE